MLWWLDKQWRGRKMLFLHPVTSLILLISLLLLWLLVPLLAVCESHGGCAEVDSLTEAVVGKGFLLGCISCKNREEVRARAIVDWHFKPPEEEEFRHVSQTQVHSNLESNYVPVSLFSAPHDSQFRFFFYHPAKILSLLLHQIHIWGKSDFDGP